MFNSSILDSATGMIFIYLLLSLICSAANEIIERYSKKRGRDLEHGIKEMLRSDDLVKNLYEHPLVYSLFAKPYSPGAKNLPSYIPARNFALALMDIAAPSGASGATGVGESARSNLAPMRGAIAANTNLPEDIRKALLTLIDASVDNPAKVRENIENWFDSSMDRVSGWYKRRSQLIVLLLGLGLSILLNVDSVALVRTLSTDRAMRDSLVAAAQEYAKSNTRPPAPASASPSPSASPKSQASPSASSSPRRSAASTSSSGSPSPSPGLTATATPSPTSGATGKCDMPECRVKENLIEIKKLGLPIGWTREESDPPDPRQLYGVSLQGWVLRAFGWLITALALSLGAPFWFDLLNKFIVIRSTVKPKEKSPEEKSKD